MDKKPKEPTQMTQDQVLLGIFNELPKVIQEAILYSDWQNVVRRLVKQYGLHIDKGTQLENMVFSIMLGQTTGDELFEFILEDLSLPEKSAMEMFKEIDFKIFDPISKQIIAMNQQSKINEARSEEPGASAKPKVSEEETKEKISNQQTFVKDDREISAMDDEILTVTRDEILKNIEDPSTIKGEDRGAKIPDVNDLGAPVKKDTPVASDNKPVSPTPAATPQNNTPSAPSANTPSTGLNPLPKVSTPKPKQVDNRFPPYEPTAVKTETPATTPQEPSVEIPKPETSSPDSAPINPIDAGLQNKVSTSTKNYGGTDPYRELPE